MAKVPAANTDDPRIFPGTPMVKNKAFSCKCPLCMCAAHTVKYTQTNARTGGMFSGCWEMLLQKTWFSVLSPQIVAHIVNSRPR